MSFQSQLLQEICSALLVLWWAIAHAKIQSCRV